MTRRIPILVVSVGLCALAFLLFSDSRGDGPTAVDETPEQTAGSSSVTPNTYYQSDLAANSPTLPGEPSEDEKQVLVMYGEMANAFAENHGNCHKMAASIETVVDTHADSLVRLLTDRASMSPEQVAVAQRRLNQQQGPRMQKLRHSMKQAVAQCKHNKRLMNAMRSLAKLKAPS